MSFKNGALLVILTQGQQECQKKLCLCCCIPSKQMNQYWESKLYVTPNENFSNPDLNKTCKPIISNMFEKNKIHHSEYWIP